MEIEKYILGLERIPSEGDEQFRLLSNAVNDLIVNDFDKLIYILYRVDVSEKKLRGLLEESTADAGVIIARMLLEREAQKRKFRAANKINKNDIPEDDRW